MSLQQQFQEYYERDERTIMQQAAKQISELARVYKTLPALIDKVSQHSGIGPERLVSIVSFAASLHGIEWYRALSLFDTFYTYKDDIILSLTQDEERQRKAEGTDEASSVYCVLYTEPHADV
jgi:hypothetical protein